MAGQVLLRRWPARCPLGGGDVPAIWMATRCSWPSETWRVRVVAVGVEIRRNAQPSKAIAVKGSSFDPSGRRALTGAVIFTFDRALACFWGRCRSPQSTHRVPESSVAWTGRLLRAPMKVLDWRPSSIL